MSSILETLFSSTSRVRILDLFLQNPDHPFYQREIERITGQPIRAVQREVERLESMGLLVKSVEGNRGFYRLNQGFPLLPALTLLFQKGEKVMPEKLKRRKAEAIPEPSTIQQPFSWMETPPPVPLPNALRRYQIEREWDRTY